MVFCLKTHVFITLASTEFCLNICVNNVSKHGVLFTDTRVNNVSKHGVLFKYTCVNNVSKHGVLLKITCVNKQVNNVSKYYMAFCSNICAYNDSKYGALLKHMC